MENNTPIPVSVASDFYVQQFRYIHGVVMQMIAIFQDMRAIHTEILSKSAPSMEKTKERQEDDLRKRNAETALAVSFEIFVIEMTVLYARNHARVVDADEKERKTRDLINDLKKAITSDIFDKNGKRITIEKQKKKLEKAERRRLRKTTAGTHQVFQTNGWDDILAFSLPVQQYYNQHPEEAEQLASNVQGLTDVVLFSEEELFHQVIGDESRLSLGRFAHDFPNEENPVEVIPTYRFTNDLELFVFSPTTNDFIENLPLQGRRLLELMHMYYLRARSLNRLRARMGQLLSALNLSTKSLFIDVNLAHVCLNCEYYTGYNLLDLDFITGDDNMVEEAETALFDAFGQGRVELEEIAERKKIRAAKKGKQVDEVSDSSSEELLLNSEEEAELADLIGDEENSVSADEDTVVMKPTAEEESSEEYSLDQPDDDAVADVASENSDEDSFIEPGNAMVVVEQGNEEWVELPVSTIVARERSLAPWRSFFHTLILRGLDFVEEFQLCRGKAKNCLKKYANFWYGQSHRSDDQVTECYDNLRRERGSTTFQTAMMDFIQSSDNTEMEEPFRLFLGELWAYAATLVSKNWKTPACREESAFHLFRICDLMYAKGIYAIDHEPGFLDPAERLSALDNRVNSYLRFDDDVVISKTLALELAQQPGLLFVEQCWLCLPEEKRDEWYNLADFLDEHCEGFSKNRMWWGNPDVVQYPFWYRGSRLETLMTREIAGYLEQERDVEYAFDLSLPSLKALLADQPLLFEMVRSLKIMGDVMERIKAEGRRDALIQTIEVQQPFCSRNPASFLGLFAQIDHLWSLHQNGISHTDLKDQLLFVDCPLSGADVRRHNKREGHAHMNDFGASTLTLVATYLLALRSVSGLQIVAPPVLAPPVTTQPMDLTNLIRPKPKRDREDDDDEEKDAKKARFKMFPRGTTLG